MRSNQFVDSLHEVFERFGRIEAKRMFGGFGIYHDGRMFALVADDTLYLKTDADTVAHFERLKLPPFSYEKAGKMTPTSYLQAPPEVFEDRDEAVLWARRAYEAALRSGYVPKAKKRSTPAVKGAKPKPKKKAA